MGDSRIVRKQQNQKGGGYMTLEYAKKLLSEKGIPFIETIYESEKEYWLKNKEFENASFKNAREMKVATIVIMSNNKHKNLILQFYEKNNEFEFDDMLFGAWFFEMFDYNPDMLVDDLLHNIEFVMSGNAMVIDSYKICHGTKKWYSDAIFNMSDDENVSDKLGFEKALARIEQKKSFLKTLFGVKMYYDIYDWNTYRNVVK